MLLTVVGEDESVRPLDLDPGFAIGELLEILAAEFECSLDGLVLFYEGAPLEDKARTLRDYNVKENDMLLLRTARQPVGAGNAEDAEIERVRQRIINDATVRQRLQQSQPQLVAAATSGDRKEFTRMMRDFHSQVFSTEREQATMLHRLHADPFDAEAQRRIEELIRQQNIAENLETAMEYHPESFGTVTMLYVLCKVNGRPIKAFVDCGAQTTIMSEECAQKCGLDRLLDTRFSGIAKGVGTSKILGRVHTVQLQLGSSFLPSSVTVIEGNGPDMLLGLDMLRRHQCVVDLCRNVLRVNDEDVPYLPESEIPKDEQHP